MALELERLTEHVEHMARDAAQRREREDRTLDDLRQRLREQATSWNLIHEAVDQAIERLNAIRYHSARPLGEDEPLDKAIGPHSADEEATLVACDGSQIMPDRHAAFLYAAINVGIIIYFHGDGRAPLQETHPTLSYPGGEDDGLDEESFSENNTVVTLRRDLAEIETLVDVASGQRTSSPHPVLALLDQRPLYRAMGASENSEVRRVLQAWQAAMSRAREEGVLVVGYIDRPGTRSVVTMLRTLDILNSDFDANSLLQHSDGAGVTDAALFSRLLDPGQRSTVFVDVSRHNEQFKARDEGNEVCFFYLNPGARHRSLARVDVPRWVAEDSRAVDLIQALVYDQCQIMGDYPYVLARADELAVIGYRDRENLDIMIENAMERHGLAGTVTAKQSSKDVARAGRSRHEI
jgi:hypothetical protein